MSRKIVLIIIILCSLEFYNLAFIPEGVLRFVRMIAIAIMLVLLVIFMVYGKTRPGRMRFALPIGLIGISVLISMFGAYAFHDQPFSATALGQQAVYFYLIYFLLHYLKVPIAFIKKIFTYFAVVYIILYFAQHALYPIALTNSKILVDRGTLRISLSGGGFLVIAYYFWLYQVFKTRKLGTIVLLLSSLGVFILMASRQVIAAIILLTFLFLVQSKMVKSKLFIFLMVALAVFPLYFIFQDIIYSIFEVTLSQSQSLDSYIRVKAAKFFLTDFFPENLAYFTGNGASGDSEYGLRILKYAQKYGFYQTDLGLIGEYTKFGVLFVIGVIMILYRALRSRLPEDLMFIKYNFLGILLTIVVGAGVFGASSPNVLINSMLLYLVDAHLNEKKSTASPGPSLPGGAKPEPSPA